MIDDYREEIELLNEALVRELAPLRVMLAGALAFQESGEDLPDDEDVDIFLLVILREETETGALRAGDSLYREFRKELSLQMLMATPDQIVNRREQRTPWLEMVLEKSEILYESPDFDPLSIDPEEN